ncbi:MAG TPA: hypothetical protein VM939_03110 [Gemmatimonadaceae bacterium]|nr:hypothetical protein [Gemmatimonadaceae bacterium]
MERPMVAVAAPTFEPEVFAPLALFAFNRLDLLQTTLASLERSRGFLSSPVHIFSDGARLDHPAEVAEVARLREWVREWCAQYGATLHEARTNRGLRTSIVSGVSDLLRVHDSVIVLEDDLVVSPSFLTFMNQAVDMYRDRRDIFQVSGYFVPHRRRLPPIGLLRVPGSWGWATWRRAWQHYSDDAGALLAELRTRDSDDFDVGGSYGHLEALERNAAGTLDTWLVRWYASVFLRGGLTVYPGQSLVRNIGFDPRATNCGPGGTARTYTRQKISRRPVRAEWHDIGSEETPEFVEALQEFNRWQQAQWVKPTWNERLRARLRVLAARTPWGHRGEPEPSSTAR